MKETVKVGLMGFGTVGTGVVRLVNSYQEDLMNQTGVTIEISKILVKDVEKKRQVDVDRDRLVTDPNSIIYDDEIEVVIEVMGGVEPAREYILKAIEQGKHIVTANKDLMALHGEEIITKAAKHGCDIFYEASVAGGIPILRTIVDGFSSDRITKIMGIVNGTTNYILTKMSKENASYDEVLKEAQNWVMPKPIRHRMWKDWMRHGKWPSWAPLAFMLV